MLNNRVLFDRFGKPPLAGASLSLGLRADFTDDFARARDTGRQFSAKNRPATETVPRNDGWPSIVVFVKSHDRPDAESRPKIAGSAHSGQVFRHMAEHGLMV